MINKVKNRVLSLLNEHVPEELAFKGISKISPELGSFLTRGLSAGLPIASGLDFLRNKLSNEETSSNSSLRADEKAAQTQIKQSRNESNNIKSLAKLGLGIAGGAGLSGLANGLVSNALTQNPQSSSINPVEPVQPNEPMQQPNQAPNNQNIIEQYSPDLHQFLLSEIQKGRSPIEAGALAQVSGKFKKEIARITKDHKADWSAIIESVFGKGEVTQERPKTQGNADDRLTASMEKLLQALKG